MKEIIACLGAGRMGRGIAVVFASAGHEVVLVDFKARDKSAFQKLSQDALSEVRNTLATLAGFGMFEAAAVDTLMTRVSVVPESAAQVALSSASIIFEGVPEVLDLKREALARASKLAGPKPVIASTTSTILVDDLSSAVDHPERFLNAHWLNPAFLVPLVEVSPGKHTDPNVTARVKGLLESVGKVPVVCAARPGYIVPRIQALAMNEAARMVEEGVASAQDIDKAIKYGFGFRFAVLGMLEFIAEGASRRMAAYSELVAILRGSLRSHLRMRSELHHPLLHHHRSIHRDRGAHHRQVEVPRGVAPGELVRAGGEQEIAGNRADLGAVGVALAVHRQRLIARLSVEAEADMRHRVGVL